jgi:hypothetical protein
MYIKLKLSDERSKSELCNGIDDGFERLSTV